MGIRKLRTNFCVQRKNFSQDLAISIPFSSRPVQNLRSKLTNHIDSNNTSTDDCSELPNIAKLELATITQFPVSYNTPVTVKCGSGYSLEGSDVITCIKGVDYRSIDGHLPSCKESE